MNSIPDEILSFANHAKIELFTREAPSYFNTSNFNASDLVKSHTWHMVVAHHKQKFTKEQILKAIYKVVDGEEFYPVAYRKEGKVDRFLVRSCAQALRLLFEQKLAVPMNVTEKLQLTVKLCVATFTLGQISPTRAIERALNVQFEHLKQADNIRNILDLENFGSHPEFRDIVINMANRPTFELVCKALAERVEEFNSLNGLQLSKNGIRSLVPMRNFDEAEFQLLDLRLNDLKKVVQFKNLSRIKIEALWVAGNQVTTLPGYEASIKELLPNMVKLDGRLTQTLMSTVKEEVIERVYSGTEIEPEDLKQLSYFKTSLLWHEISIDHNGRYSKSEILEAFFAELDENAEAVYPCSYKVGDTQDTFFVRNCFDQLSFLVANTLLIHMDGYDDLVSIRLRMNVAPYSKSQFDPSEVVAQAAAERFNIGEQVLNLDNFGSSPSLKNVAISLSSPKILHDVLWYCSRKFSEVTVIVKLGNNGIRSAKALTLLGGFKKLKVLDLSNNKISQIQHLEALARSNISELILDGNPLCRNYTSGMDYISDVKKLFPGLTKLDGQLLSEGESSFKRNFLCSIKGYDFVEQFVTTYFKGFDSKLRPLLINMYHPMAIMSLSCGFDPQKVIGEKKARIGKYQLLSRNLLNASDRENGFSSLHIGYDDITKVLEKIPETKHDFMSFTTDTLLFEPESLVVIRVTGVFQEPADSFLENDLFFSFSRTFVLQAVGRNLGVFGGTAEYQITNDQLFLTDPTQTQLATTFKYEVAAQKSAVIAETPEEKEHFLQMFQQITGLKSIWCTKCLENGKWSFRRGLQEFVDLQARNKIPPTAYVEDEETLLPFSESV